MKRILTQLLALSGIFIVGSASADGFALGAKVGTLGIGVEGTFGLLDHLNLRASVNSYSRSLNETDGGIDYHADADLKSTALLFDFHPFAGTFRLSAGLVNNRNAAHLTATPNNGVTIGGTFFPGNTAGTISGDVTFKKNAPYLGIGWGNAVSKGSPFGFTAEIGALFQGKANVTLRSSNPAVTQADLSSEAQQAADDIIKTYPVVSLGFSYRF